MTHYTSSFQNSLHCRKAIIIKKPSDLIKAQFDIYDFRVTVGSSQRAPGTITAGYIEIGVADFLISPA